MIGNGVEEQNPTFFDVTNDHRLTSPLYYQNQGSSSKPEHVPLPTLPSSSSRFYRC